MSAGCEGCKAMQAANDELARENAGLDGIVRRAGRTEQALRVELTRSREEEAGSEDVRELLELWRDEVVGGSTRVNVGMGGPRATRVKWAIKVTRKYGGMDTLRDAIRGVTLDEWAMGLTPNSTRTFCDLADHIFKSEATIEKFADMWRIRQEANAKADGAPAPYPEQFRRSVVRPPRTLPAESVLAGYVEALRGNAALLARLKVVKGWEAAPLVKLGVGWTGQRLVFPVRDADGRLINAVHYLPGGSPKSLAVAGRPRGLWPAPESIEGEGVFLTEGESDCVTAHGLGLPGVSVPGTSGWKSEWAPRFAGRKVVIAFDCDKVGREAAHRVADSLAPVAASVRVLDLDRHRDDGWDLSDAVRDGMGLTVLRELVIATPVVQRTEAA
ncbi:MAG: hypothetical protein M3Q39_06305 [Actinomycetota bacterium]|nr:hypothetical protein [Actinomycetota bacterium]